MLAVFQWNETAPSSAATAASSQAVTGTDPNSTAGILSSAELESANGLLFIAELQGNTGGTLDVYVQTFILGVWYDFLHVKQVPAGNTTVKYVYQAAYTKLSVNGTAISTSTTPALAADTILSGPWGEKFRLLMVSGSGTTLGAPVKMTILAQLPRMYYGR